MKIHFIAIGGAVMHNLAIVLRRKGNEVTGSDDKITDPAKSNLEKEGIMPPRIGFYEDFITPDLDAVIVGMHARADNPELLKAQQLGLRIYSFPEYLYEVSKNKKRVVIAGSHGKTTITSMIMHVLKENRYDFDYMVGAKVKGFDTGVRITETAPLIILEGDEYLASPIHPESKFMYYHPHLALLTGIAWDHVNVFPQYDGYVNQFRKFAHSIEPGGFIAWFAGDEELKNIFRDYKEDVRTSSYHTHPYYIQQNTTILATPTGHYPLKVFGEHNLQNIAGAHQICTQLGITHRQFYKAIATFEGAANRLQLLGGNDHTLIYKDFAHSPSKLRATIHALKQQYPSRALVAVMELHTFSSLNRDFLSQYQNTMNEADLPVIFYDRETFQLKKMPLLEEELVKKEFNNPGLHIFTDAASLQSFLFHQNWNNKNLLLMTSGHFAGMDLAALSRSIVG